MVASLSVVAVRWTAAGARAEFGAEQADRRAVRDRWRGFCVTRTHDPSCSIVLELIFYGWISLALMTGAYRRWKLELAGIWLVVVVINEYVIGSGALRFLFTEYAAFCREACAKGAHRIDRDHGICGFRSTSGGTAHLKVVRAAVDRGPSIRPRPVDDTVPASRRRIPASSFTGDNSWNGSVGSATADAISAEQRGCGLATKS